METPYEKRLGTNYVPTVDEARHIQMIVDEATKEISHLNAQIDLLQEKKNKIQTFADRHQALLSPMRQLTRDVLEEIFLACLPMDRNPCMSAIEAPMLLTHICRSWRQIALSTPMMWAKIHIALPVVTVWQHSSQEDLIVQEGLVGGILKRQEIAVNEWLSQSYACPLSISIYTHLSDWYNPICENIERLHASFMRNPIIPHHNHWRDFDIYAADDTLCAFLDTGLTAESLEMLQTFHVTRYILDISLLGVPPYQWKDIALLMPSRITHAIFPSRGRDIVMSLKFGQDMIKSLLRTTDDFYTLTILSPYWALSSRNLVQLLEVTPSLCYLNISSKSIFTNRWSSSSQESLNVSFTHLINDDLLQALVPMNKSDSDIICRNLETFISGRLITTGINETCLKEFVIARANDKQVAPLRQISLYINQPKQTQASNTSKVSLGTDSAVYFRRTDSDPHLKASETIT